MNNASDWSEVTPSAPCPACGKPDWCARAPSGCLKCERATTPPDGMKLGWVRDGGAIFIPGSAEASTYPKRPDYEPINWVKAQQSFQKALKPEMLQSLAKTLGLPTRALEAVQPGWADGDALRRMKAGGSGWLEKYPFGAFTFPERDGNGRISGVSLRDPDGRKGFPSKETGAGRGLIVSSGMHKLPDPVLAVEGATDVAACEALGLAAVGRMSNSGGSEQIAQMLRSREVIAVGENDQKPDGSWPGRDGPMGVASNLARAWRRPVAWTLPPPPAKDIRAWLNVQVEEGLDLADQDACARAGRQLLAELRAKAEYRLASSADRAWPSPPAEAAFHGIAGDFVRTVLPETESDPSALLTQYLTCAGNVIGRTAYALVESTRHYLALDVAIVGRSSKARKGTSLSHVKAMVGAVDQEWASTRIITGLSSGEGLIHTVRDARDADNRDADPGVADKRAMVLEPEFVTVLQHSRREGNILSATLRNAWDGNQMQTLNKNSPERATAAHVSIIAHITDAELAKEWSSVQSHNGFGNRFLWVCAQRSKLLANGGRVCESDMARMVGQLAAAVRFARDQGEIRREAEADELWAFIYPMLTAERQGTSGALTARAEAQVLRLSALYAVLDRSALVRVVHLRAALALYDYVMRSVRYVFGDSLGSPLADAVLTELRARPEGLTRTDIRDLLGRNARLETVNAALNELRSANLARQSMERTEGRSAERWFAVDPQVGGCDSIYEASLRFSGGATTETTKATPESDLRSFPSYSPPVAVGVEVAASVGGVPDVLTTETTEGTVGGVHSSFSPPTRVREAQSDPGSPPESTTETTKGVGPEHLRSFPSYPERAPLIADARAHERQMASDAGDFGSSILFDNREAWE